MKTVKNLLAAALIVGVLIVASNAVAEECDSKTLGNVARDIEKLKTKYPQLGEFTVEKNLRIRRCAIEYSFDTHQPSPTGGWTSGVPNPNAKGVWFYIDIHNPDSMSAIHQQPVSTPYCLGRKRVAFLILEGVKTKSLDAVLRSVLMGNKIEQCARG